MTKQKKGLHFVASYLPQGQIFDPLMILELVSFFSQSLSDPKTAQGESKKTEEGDTYHVSVIERKLKLVSGSV